MLRKIFVAALATACAVANAQSLKVEKYRLANGMTVILHEDHRLPVATVNIWYHVGSKDEPERRSGFAHLFEHLMFMGTKRVPTGQLDKIMEGEGGSNNASTSEDRTNFYSIGPSALLPTLLWLDADRLEDLGNAIDQHKLDLQREVVKNERRERTENTPYGKAYEIINSLMFPKGHPYDHSVIGSMADLDAATVQDVQQFFATYYVPNNASLVVAGDFDPKTVKALIGNLFGSLPRRDDPVHRTGPNPNLNGVRRLTLVDKVQFPKTIMVWHSAAAYRPGDADLQLAASILSDGLTSRLYQRLVARDKVATDVSANQSPLQLGSLFTVDATAAAGVPLTKLERAIDETLAQFAREGPRPDELQRAVAKIEFGAVSGLESIQNVADRMNEFEFYLGEPNSFNPVLNKFRSATVESVQNAALHTLNPNARLILRVVPETEVKPAQAAAARDRRPASAPTRALIPPLPVVFRLSNGAKVEYWHRPELPMMAIATMLRGGSALDPTSKLGRAQITAEMLDEGAGPLGAAAFHDSLDALGASFSASAGPLATFASMSVLSTNFDAAIGLYADALLRPRFDPDEFKRVQRIATADLEQEVDDADLVAQKVGLRELLGRDHPFGRPSSGTPETVASLTVRDVQQAHAQVFEVQNATIFVAGSLGQTQVRAELERVFGGWRAGGETIGLPITPPAANTTFRVLLVDKPGAVQTVIRFVMPAPTYSSPKRQALSSLDTLLGGSFTSRLNQNLRETHGYAYGAGSGMNFGPTIGTTTASADVRANVTGPAIREFLAEFKRLATGDVTPEEAAKAAATRRSDVVEALSSLQGLLSVAENYDLNGRPFSDLGRELEAMSKLGAADLNAIAGEALPLGRGVLVLVGDKATILQQIEGIAIPPPQEVSAQG